MLEYFLLAYILFTAAMIYILLCGQSQFHRNGLVGKLHTLLTESAPRLIGQCTTCCMPKALRSKVFGCADYVMHKKNPILAIFYVMLVLVGYFVFYYYGASYLPNRHVGMTQWWLGHVFVWITLGWYFYLVFSDPGVITKENVKEHMAKYRYDGFIYGTAECRVCQIPKPPRSKHCYTCGVCVARFDHHCPWLNADVGATNMWKFLVYLLMTAMLCNYAALVSGNTIRAIVEDNGFFSRQFPDRNGNMRFLPYSVIAEWAVSFHAHLVALFFFTAVISLTMYGFFIYQFLMAIKNITTYETHKWSDIREYVSHQDRVRKAKGITLPPKPPTAGIPRRAEDLTMSDLENIYNRGVWNNLSEVFYYDQWPGMEGAQANLAIFNQPPPPQEPQHPDDQKQNHDLQKTETQGTPVKSNNSMATKKKK